MTIRFFPGGINVKMNEARELIASPAPTANAGRRTEQTLGRKGNRTRRRLMAAGLKLLLETQVVHRQRGCECDDVVTFPIVQSSDVRRGDFSVANSQGL